MHTTFPLPYLSSSTVFPAFIATDNVAVLSFCHCVWCEIEITCTQHDHDHAV